MSINKHEKRYADDTNGNYDVYGDELDALQISDSMFPTGMFASSGGLELMYAQNMIKTADELSELCKNMIERQVGVSDCIALANAYDAADHIDDVKTMQEADAVCCSMKTVSEAREASVRSGVQLCKCVAGFCSSGNNEYLIKYMNWIKNEQVFGAYPVSLGVCCRALGIRKEKAVLILLYGFVAGMTSAALRLGMIQHFEAQKIIHDLKPVMREMAKSSVEKKMSDAWQFCPHVEILQMAHERMDPKMFIT